MLRVPELVKEVRCTAQALVATYLLLSYVRVLHMPGFAISKLSRLELGVPDGAIATRGLVLWATLLLNWTCCGLVWP